MKTSPEKVLALVDLVSTDRYKVYRTQEFPFVQALAAARGFTVRWLCVGVNGEAQAARDNPFLFQLPEDDLERLCQRLSQLRPSHLLINERLEESCWRQVLQAAPGARTASMDARVYTWFGVPEEAIHDTFNIFDTEPDFRRELLTPLARKIKPYTWLMLGPLCLYRRPLARNPLFEGVNLEACTNPDACSFCLPNRDIPNAADPVAEALRQALAAERTTPSRVHSHQYMTHGANLWFKIGAFADALIDSPLPGSAFFFHTRVDELLRKASELEARLPGLQARGHSINLHSIGVENFSPAENERLNKHITAEQVLEAAELMRRWEETWPDAFIFRRHGGFSFILFTPWTTLEDLQLNLAGLRRLRDLNQDVNFALRTRMQLLPGRAITALAVKDGVVGDPDDAHQFDSGCITDWSTEELPWHFKDRRVPLIYRLSRRLAGDPAVPANDSDLTLLRAWLETRARPQDRSAMALVTRAVEIMEASPEVDSMAALLQRLTLALDGDTAAPISIDLGARGVQLCVRGPCNLACLFCNLFQDQPEVNQVVHERELAYEINRLASSGTSAASWGLYHHEPTTLPALPRLVAQAKEQGIRHNRLITNGILTADPAYCQELLDAGVDSMVLTLVEYDEASADTLCQGDGVTEARRRTLENCRDLGIEVYPVLTLMRANYQQVGAAMDLYGDLVQQHTLQLVSPTMGDRVAWFMPPLSGVMEVVTEAARQRPEHQLTLVDIPACIRRHFGQELPNISHREENAGGIYPEQCEGCEHRQGCGGFSSAYQALYGLGEAAGGEAIHSPLSLEVLRTRSARYINEHRPYHSSGGVYSAASRKLNAILTEILVESPADGDARGLQITSVKLEHHERVSVLARFRGASLNVLVSWRQRSDKALLRVGPFALMTPAQEQLDSEAKQQGIKRLARVLLDGWKRGPA